MKKLMKLKCPSCGASLSIEEKRDHFFCEYCGSKIVLDNDNEFIIRQIDEADVKRAETEHVIKLKDIEFKEKEMERNSKLIKNKIIASIILGIVGVLMIVIGYALAKSSGDSDSAWGILSLLGIMPFFASIYIWT